jgi:PAS domain S-box-containing protein
MMRRLRERRATFPLRHLLLALVLLALVPVLIFTGTVVWSLGREQRQSVERGLQTTVRALAVAVEREIGATVSALEVVAASTALDRGDLRTFYEHARRAIETHEEWYVVALTDTTGQLLLSTLRPLGAPLPSIADRDYFEELVRSRRPVVSDLIAGRTTGWLNVTVAVPVERDGALRYVLFAAVSPRVLGNILAAQWIPPDWIAGIVDRKQVIVARNRRPERFVGHGLPPLARDAVRDAAFGTGRYPVLDGGDVYAAWQRTTWLGWTVALGAPVEAVDVPLRRSMWRFTVGGILGIIAGGALALALGRRISGSMSGLASAAVALGQGAAPHCVPSLIQEAHAVGQAMEKAGRTIDERTAELRESQASVKRLVDSSLIGVLIGEDDVVTDANDAFLAMVGYSREDLRAGALRGPTLTPPEYATADAAAVATAQQAGRCTPYEKEYVRKDGTHVSVLVGRVSFGETHQWASFALDLTERNRLEAERALRIQAQAASQAKDDFLAVVSHELRTPLGVVLTSLPLLRRPPSDRPDYGAILDRIERNTRLQARLVDDLLDASRITAGKLRVDKQAVHPAAIVASAAAALAPEAQHKGVKLSTALSAPRGHVLGDPERLQQIALNLIANAIKFTPPGGRVDVALGHRGARAVLTVRDTGCGIAAENIPHVFERFWQGAAGRREGGLGLGLAIVRHLVEAHEGTVRVESPGVGRGTVFTVELPLDTRDRP